jgi:hypothetical protein
MNYVHNLVRGNKYQFFSGFIHININKWMWQHIYEWKFWMHLSWRAKRNSHVTLAKAKFQKWRWRSAFLALIRRICFADEPNIPNHTVCGGWRREKKTNKLQIKFNYKVNGKFHKFNNDRCKNKQKLYHRDVTKIRNAVTGMWSIKIECMFNIRPINKNKPFHFQCSPSSFWMVRFSRLLPPNNQPSSVVYPVLMMDLITTWFDGLLGNVHQHRTH